jgi:hypothetical protein
MLLLVILAALALASLTGSLVYRLGRARRTVRVAARRRDIRQSADTARRPPWADLRPEDLADVARHYDFAPRRYSADAQPKPTFARDRV